MAVLFDIPSSVVCARTRSPRRPWRSSSRCSSRGVVKLNTIQQKMEVAGAAAQEGVGPARRGDEGDAQGTRRQVRARARPRSKQRHGVGPGGRVVLLGTSASCDTAPRSGESWRP